MPSRQFQACCNYFVDVAARQVFPRGLLLPCVCFMCTQAGSSSSRTARAQVLMPCLDPRVYQMHLRALFGCLLALIREFPVQQDTQCCCCVQSRQLWGCVAVLVCL
jgi:hypothetical protein